MRGDARTSRMGVMFWKQRGGRVVLLAVALLSLGAKPERGRVRKIDRMWVVGRPALDGAPEGVYAWVADGRFRFAVSAGPEASRPRVYRFTVKGTSSLRLETGGDCKVAAKADGRRGLVLAARPGREAARCGVQGSVELTVSGALQGGRAIPVFVGPGARRAAKSVRIGRY